MPKPKQKALNPSSRTADDGGGSCRRLIGNQALDFHKQDAEGSKGASEEIRTTGLSNLRFRRVRKEVGNIKASC